MKYKQLDILNDNTCTCCKNCYFRGPVDRDAGLFYCTKREVKLIILNKYRLWKGCWFFKCKSEIQEP